jgi:hypothetical protein
MTILQKGSELIFKNCQVLDGNFINIQEIFSFKVGQYSKKHNLVDLKNWDNIILQ